MRRETRDELLLGFLAINAMLREELRGLRRTLRERTSETKYNPNWAKQPRAPKGTPIGGRWVDGGTPKQDPAPFESPQQTPQETTPQRLPTAANDNALTAANDNEPFEDISISVSRGFLAAVTMPLPLYGDTPRPRVEARQITGDLFLVVTEISGERYVSFQRQVPDRNSLTILGIETGLLSTESVRFEILPVQVRLEGDEATFNGDALAAAYGRHISGITWSLSASSPLQILPMTPEERRLDHNLREFLHATPEQIAISIQQFRNSEADGEPFITALRERGATLDRARRIRRALRFERSATPYVPPTSGPLVDMFPGLSTAQPGQSLYAVDNVELPISELDHSQEALALMQEIGSIDPDYRSYALDVSRVPPSHRRAHLDRLRLERAALLWRVRQEAQPLQIEMIHLAQRRVDLAYADAVRRQQSGELPDSRFAVGDEVHRIVQAELRDTLADLGIAEDEIIGVNRALRPRRVKELRPDIHVWDIFIEITIDEKDASTEQIIDYYELSYFAPRHVIVIRPRLRGPSSLVIPWRRRYSRN